MPPAVSAGIRRLALPILALMIPWPTLAQAPPPKAVAVDSLWNVGARTEALDLLAREIPASRAAGDTLLLSNLLVRRGIFQNFRGEGREAESTLREACGMARARGDSTLLVSAVRWLSVAVGSQGRLAEAVPLYTELLDLAVALDDKRNQGWAHIGLAWANWRDGNSEAALAGYTRAAEVFPGTGDVEGELWANNGIATVNNNLGRYEQAAAGYRGSIAAAQANGQVAAEAMALNNLGTLEYSLGRSDVALGHFRRALDLQKGLENKRTLLSPMFNIALCQNGLGRIDAAGQTLEEALAICETYGYRDQRCRALVKLAGLEMQRGRLNSAASLIAEAMADPEAMLRRDVAEARIELGEGYRRAENYPAALAQYDQADSLLAGTSYNWVRLRLGGHRAQALRSMGESERALDLFMDLAARAEALELPEFHMMSQAEAGRTCRELGRLESARALLESAAADWEDDRRLLLSPEWRERRGASGRFIYTDLADLLVDAGEPAAAFERLQSYKARTLLERRLGPGATFTETLADGSGDLVRLVDLQTRVLDRGELLLDFTVGPWLSLVFAVTPDTVIVRRLPKASDLEGLARAYYDLLKRPDAGSPDALSAVGSVLASQLLPDLKPLFAVADRILAAPDGALNLLPFADFDIGVEDPAWVRVPSASLLADLRRTENQPMTEASWRVLAVAGDPGEGEVLLPGTLREVEALERDFASVEVRTLDLGNGALPDLSDHEILHFAAHTRNNDQSPWQSAIHFLPGETEGRLRAVDILDLDLDARLAVLSSCGSAGGKTLNGEGVLGLSSAFLGAGVSAVLATLWAVDDGATVRFMTLYYGYLSDGLDCGQALARAQADLRGNPATAHPYYWAGFVLIGDGALQPDLSRSGDYLVPAALGLLGMSLLWVFIRRRV